MLLADCSSSVSGCKYPSSTIWDTFVVKKVRCCCKASTAVNRSRPASDLSRKPRAPADRTSRTTWSLSCMVRIRMRICGVAARICLAASSPLRFGMPMSSRMTSGFNVSAIATASRPSLASPHTAQPGCASSRKRMPLRATSWSSAIRIRSGFEFTRQSPIPSFEA